MKENDFIYQWEDSEDIYLVEVVYRDEKSLLDLLEKFILSSLEEDGVLF
ncbi:hypothetical protein [Anaerosinus sp.]